MPSRSHTRFASRTALTEQQPFSASEDSHSCIVTPVTSWPCSRSSAAATEESTPPLMATKTRTPLPLASGRHERAGQPARRPQA